VRSCRIDALFENTGRKVLSWWGLKSDRFIEVLVGILFWAIFGIVFAALVLSLIGR